MNEVGRAIQRIHNPAEAGIVRRTSCAFLRQKAGLRKQGLQPLDQPGFRRLVNMADKGIQALDFDVSLGHPLLDEVLTDGANDLNGSESQRFSIE